VTVSTGSGGEQPECEQPPNVPGPEVVLAPDYVDLYDVFDLGPVPGVPDPLGGCVVKHDDPNTLLIAGQSERPDGAIYSIELERGPCGHILGFVGTAQLYAETPYVDANLLYGPDDLMFYSQWPQFKLSQLPSGASAPALDIDLVPLGMVATGDSGAGGLGFVPPGLQAEAQLRAVSWPGGRWYHIDMTPNGNLWDVTTVTETVQLENGPGGFAYVPAGSPGFDEPSVIVSEWSQQGAAADRVTTYEIDQQGDPIVSTRKEFFSSFDRPWGAYFEPETGDYLFLQWGTSSPPDRVYIVQGFVPPPPPPEPPN